MLKILRENITSVSFLLKLGRSESSQHYVNVSEFFMGKYTVIRQAVMGNNPSRFREKNRPVERVSWNNATKFCKKLSKKMGKDYRLPSEAEWEYA